MEEIALLCQAARAGLAVDADIRRLVLRVTARIAEPATALYLHDRLIEALVQASQAPDDATRAEEVAEAIAILQEIEARSE